jgi:hypothetical protein
MTQGPGLPLSELSDIPFMQKPQKSSPGKQHSNDFTVFATTRIGPVMDRVKHAVRRVIPFSLSADAKERVMKDTTWADVSTTGRPPETKLHAHHELIWKLDEIGSERNRRRLCRLFTSYTLLC